MQHIRDALLIIIGAFALSFSVVGFMAPNQLLDGGFTGIAIILNSLFGTPIGVVALAMMSVALLVSYILLGPAFGKKTVLATVIFTLSIDFWDKLMHLRPITREMPLAVFYGGLIAGVALATIFHTGASTGGTDALAAVIKRYTGVPLGRALLLIDVVVAFVAGLFFGPEPLMYSLILIFIETQVIDLVLNGISATERLWIVSEKWEEIRAFIVAQMGRGATVFDGEGAYTGKSRKVVIAYVPRRMAIQVRRRIHQIDPDVFLAVEPSIGVYGEGFKHAGRD
ncbi:YitT family protein [Myxococcota bacterium]|nr:YitT family protein [Myxococcota bacterium]